MGGGDSGRRVGWGCRKRIGDRMRGSLHKERHASSKERKWESFDGENYGEGKIEEDLSNDSDIDKRKGCMREKNERSFQERGCGGGVPRNEISS